MQLIVLDHKDYLTLEDQAELARLRGLLLAQYRQGWEIVIGKKVIDMGLVKTKGRIVTKQAFRIPDQAMAQHMAILGKTGSGKTYAAKGLVERLIEAGRRVCVLDPTDAWWGLRSGTDGVRPGLPVVIFGGDHADVPITEHAGSYG